MSERSGMSSYLHMASGPSEQLMLQWIRTALFNDPQPNQAVDGAVFLEMQQQGVHLLVADYLPKQLMAQNSMSFAYNVRLLHEQDQMLKLLKDNGIPVVILKGTANAVNYPNPLYRSSGDIDLWVGEKDFFRAYDVLLKNEYAIDEHGGLIEDINEFYKKHVGFMKHGVSIELHRQPFQVNDSKVDEAAVLKYMEEGLYHCEYGQMDEYVFPMLPPEQTALELLYHTKSHLRSGIGLRHIIDWMMFVNQNLNDEHYETMRPVLKQYRLDYFAAVLTRMCQMYLGLPEEGFTWAKKADDRICKTLMVRILKFGNFGRKEGVSAGTRMFMRSPGQFFIALQDGGLSRYKELFRKHKYLKPFAWILQLGRYIVYGVKNRRELINDYRNGRAMKKLYDEIF